jgi:hypothetical protein
MSNTKTHVLAVASVLWAAGCTVANPDYQVQDQPDSEPPSTGAERSDGGLEPESLPGPMVCQPRCEGDVLVSCTPDGESRKACPGGCEGDQCFETTPDPDGCVFATYYLDQDGDGFGVTTEEIQACERPKGYAALAGDCDDADSEVFPGQDEFHATASVGTGTHDYNCDGVEELERPDAVSCQTSTSGTCVGDGWTGSVPACGGSGLLASCVPYFGLGCGWWLATDVQRCR